MKKTITIAATALALSVAGLAYAQQDHSGHDMNAMSGASKAYMDAMTKMDTDMKAMPMSGKAGIDFARMMIPHHQSAIDMAKAYLESGEANAELTKLSNDVIAAQEGEIAFLKDWLAKNGG